MLDMARFEATWRRKSSKCGKCSSRLNETLTFDASRPPETLTFDASRLRGSSPKLSAKHPDVEHARHGSLRSHLASKKLELRKCSSRLNETLTLDASRPRASSPKLSAKHPDAEHARYGALRSLLASKKLDSCLLPGSLRPLEASRTLATKLPDSRQCSTRLASKPPGREKARSMLASTPQTTEKDRRNGRSSSRPLGSKLLARCHLARD